MATCLPKSPPEWFQPAWLQAAAVLALLAGGCAPPSAPTGLATVGPELAKQKPHYRIGKIPPAPILSAQEEQTTFRLPPGYRVELVAAEPLVEKPVALAFDPDGRVYVVELRSYMNDLGGTGELQPVSRVALLEDTDQDGRLDKRTVFLDGLVMPRAVGLAGGGVLVAEPPHLWLCRPDGQRQLLCDDYGSRTANPEHIANGLMTNLDNWIYSANWPNRFRFRHGRFERETVASRGQWGITHDDGGRLFFNTSGAMLLCDLVPAEFLSRNPLLRSPAGLNVAPVPNRVYPGRVNPGVNRGYTEDLDGDGKLQRVTAACGPCIYRGDRLPAEVRGNAFVCEPAGNLVARHVLRDDGLQIAGQSVQTEGRDFLTSSDERFRPVNLYTAPDGTLYLLDFYQGVLEHRTYLSAYLTDQIKRRDLARGGPYGRIWRIVHDSARPGPQPHLATASSAELVRGLSHPNGWWRDTCQRLLVERDDPAAVPLLEKATDSVTKVHALWTLQGMGRLRDAVWKRAAHDRDARVRLAALRASGRVLPELADDPDPAVRFQIMALADPAVADRILRRSLADPMFRHLAINRAAGRELELLRRFLALLVLVPDPRGVQRGGLPPFAVPEAGELLRELAECVGRSRAPEQVESLLELAAAQPPARRQSLLEGLEAAVEPKRPLRMRKRPGGAVSEKLLAAMTWPGQPGNVEVPPLTAAEARRFATGQQIFERVCAACHQASGMGQPGTAPRLVDSSWVIGPEQRLVRIALDGLRGPTRAGGKDSGLEMPAFGSLSDHELAAVLTYLRRAWGHEAAPVESETVRAIRAATLDHRGMQWKASELLQL